MFMLENMWKRILFRSFHNYSLLLSKVELDPVLRDDFVNKIYKPRKHPGVSKLKIVSLPSDLEKAIVVVLDDTSSKAFYEKSVKLGNYLRSRLLPPEQSEIDEKTVKLFKSIPAKRQSQDYSEIENEKIVQAQKVKVFNVLKKKVYGWANISYDQTTCLQYLMARGAAEFAVINKIFSDIQAKLPDYKPRSYFDFGSGIGTGTWAVNQYWKDSIFEYFCVDTSPAMHDLARLILCRGRDNVDLPLKGYFQRQFLPASSNLKYSIVLSAYSLLELPDMKTRLETIQKLWNKTEDFLVIVEQGTNAGFKVVNEAREFVLNLPKDTSSGYAFAPCPSDNVCPRYLEQDTPCNFLIRYMSLSFPSKSESKPELFTYVVLRKGQRPEVDPQWPRVVRAPIVRSKHTICRLCTANGELQEIIFTKSKHDQETYRCARSSLWGDLLPVKCSDKT